MKGWESIRELESSDTSVLKFVFEKEDAVAEAVLYKYPSYKERTVICCSTQSGCPMGCSFCGTGEKFVRNLTVDEIVHQVEVCVRRACTSEDIFSNQIEKFQIMFMSMGEPFLNYENLKDAIKKLSNRFPQAALLVSTSGPSTESKFRDFRELSTEIPEIGLQFSVHESLDEARDNLIPFKSKMTLSEIAEEGEQWNLSTGRKPFFNYCIHENNCSQDDVDRLYHYFDPSIWEVTLSVICEKDEVVSDSIDRQLDLISDFSGKLLEKGYNTRVFNPAGQDDIGGGCGQLWHVQNWYKQNPDLARTPLGCK